MTFEQKNLRIPLTHIDQVFGDEGVGLYFVKAREVVLPIGAEVF